MDSRQRDRARGTAGRTGCKPGAAKVKLILLLFSAALLSGQEPAARSYFTDTVLVDQDGVERRFYTDLVQGKTVVINVMFTTCKDSCPIMAGNFARIQEWLGPRLGKDANMLSITIDPQTDSPERLKAYAERFKARPGWYVLGGTKTNVDTVLRKLGLYV